VKFHLSVSLRSFVRSSLAKNALDYQLTIERSVAVAIASGIIGLEAIQSPCIGQPPGFIKNV
jgi:hypothetical protein